MFDIITKLNLNNSIPPKYSSVLTGHPRALNVPTRHVPSSIHHPPPLDPIKPLSTNTHPPHPSMSRPRWPSLRAQIPRSLPRNSHHPHPHFYLNRRFPRNSHHSVQILAFSRPCNSPHNSHDAPSHRASTSCPGTRVGPDGPSEFRSAIRTKAPHQREGERDHDGVVKFEHEA
jgi:hypothetical protein